MWVEPTPLEKVISLSGERLFNLMHNAPVQLKSFGHDKTHRSVLRVKMEMDYGTLLLGAKTPAEVSESSSPRHVQKSRLSDNCTLEIWFHLRHGGYHSNTTLRTWPVFFFSISSPSLCGNGVWSLRSFVCVIMIHQQTNILTNLGIKYVEWTRMSQIPAGEKARGQQKKKSEYTFPSMLRMEHEPVGSGMCANVGNLEQQEDPEKHTPMQETHIGNMKQLQSGKKKENGKGFTGCRLNFSVACFRLLLLLLPHFNFG